jgi:hypothetical protein
MKQNKEISNFEFDVFHKASIWSGLKRHKNDGAFPSRTSILDPIEKTPGVSHGLG